MEMIRNKSEKSILNESTQPSKKNSLEGNSKIFYQSLVFNTKQKKKFVPEIEKSIQKTKNIVIEYLDLYRIRDYHSHVNIYQPEKSNNSENVNKRNDNKVISPMHLKLYSSIMQNNTSKVKLPESHPSYNKDPVKRPQIPKSTKKRIDDLKTSYNFLKNYY